MQDYQPFKEDLGVQFIAFQLSEVLRWGMGYDVRANKFITENVDGIIVKESNDNPVLFDNNGNKK